MPLSQPRVTHLHWRGEHTLSTSLNPALFHANNRLSEHFARQPRIRTEALPIPPSISRPAQRASDRTKSNMSSLADKLVRHILTANVSQTPIPGGSGGQASREDRCEIGFSDRQRSVLEAEAVEAQTRDWSDVADAWSCCAGYQSDFLF